MCEVAPASFLHLWPVIPWYENLIPTARAKQERATGSMPSHKLLDRWPKEGWRQHQAAVCPCSHGLGGTKEGPDL